MKYERIDDKFARLDATMRATADRYAGETCTLNGKGAKITGRLQRFARVSCLCTSRGASFSWSAVARIMAAGGSFTA